MRELRDDRGRFVAGHRKIGGMPKGGHQTEEAKSKVSASLVGKTAEQARRWKGEEASYHAKHMWVRKHYGKPNECEQEGCSYPKVVNAGRTIIDKPSRYEWANISGEYKRERSDWVMLCPSCHRKIDMGKEKLCVV